ncbi:MULTISPECIES: TrbG/VirB9 family P-type conjugative transfer protein [Brucella/Ochrobactrum group]|uniref:TrbG/VirB9 family P-type conjugative transfer protein n=1 Tax=Brucella/Ochrobactrum group TaxID=2826938 RepID=UPI001C0500B9|nr:TrbG/VirB9 family P-type conjugative transfer protein [Brucella sp. NBRC 12950]QWK80629.1 TrbG/VirB9 family P-type conjugative transfer protein [Ochrobactrum sp. BTU1]GLU27949.1 hypothetical protein Brsp01_31820 [Brucella sp. NBRC 12950]
MNFKFLSVFFLLFLTASPALAKPAIHMKPDGRIKYYAYNEDAVYRLDVPLKSVTALQFSSMEEVQSIIIGDSASWEIVKLKSGSVVSVKPIGQNADTNMTIYTDRHVYSFELHSRPEEKNSVSGVFRSVFTYPGDAKPKSVEHELKITNRRYLVSGDAPFKPVEVHDNGLQTTFVLQKGAPRPAVFKVGPKKTEELINSRTRGDAIVVDGKSEFWVLRIGDQFVCIGRDRAVTSSGNLVLAGR